MADVKLLRTNDGVGLRDTIAELLVAVTKKEVNAIVIGWRHVNKRSVIYWNGDDLECSGLCSLVDGDIISGFNTETHEDIDPLPTKEDK